MFFFHMDDPKLANRLVMKPAEVWPALGHVPHQACHAWAPSRASMHYGLLCRSCAERRR
jgi:hypothetical protein